MTKLIPGSKVPVLRVQTQDGEWDLAARSPKSFTMVIFYRGLHCPVCKSQLEALDKKIEKFADRGMDGLAVSMDSEERWTKSRKEWDIDQVPLGYGLSEEGAREWGLYISDAISDKEPEIFSEPGLFLINPDGTLYASSVQTMPFARPALDDVLSAVDYITSKDYPARGKRT